MKTLTDTDFATGKKQGLDIKSIREDFPMLQHKINGKTLIYFDSAATNHKPKAVINRLMQLYTTMYAKPQEEHTVSKEMTSEVEKSRSALAAFINASDSKEIIFTKNCTEAINIVAQGFGRAILKEDDEIIITALEHQANIVPWQIACELSGAKIIIVPVNYKGEVNLADIESAISGRTRIISISHSSNVLGTILPVKEITALAHKNSIPVLLDAAQTAPHMPIDVQELDCDYMTFSLHKMGGPAGVGILYGKEKWLNKIPPHNGGSENSENGFYYNTHFKQLPHKFEAGTPAFEQIATVSTLLEYLTKLDMNNTAEYEQELLEYATERLTEIEGLKIYGTADEKEPVISFLIAGTDIKKLEKYLSDEHNIDVRGGELSAQPLMKTLGVQGLLRISLCFYNTRQEIDYFIDAVKTFLKK